MQNTRQQSNLDQLGPDYLDNNHIMYKTDKCYNCQNKTHFISQYYVIEMDYETIKLKFTNM